MTERSVTWATAEYELDFRVGGRDGYNDLAEREEGTRVGLDNLDAQLKREPARP